MAWSARQQARRRPKHATREGKRTLICASGALQEVGVVRRRSRWQQRDLGGREHLGRRPSNGRNGKTTRKKKTYSRKGTGQVCPRVAISARGFLLSGKDTGSGGCNESISLCRDPAPGKKTSRAHRSRPAGRPPRPWIAHWWSGARWRALTPAATLLIYWRGTAEVPRGEGAVAGQVSSHRSIRAD